MAETKKISQKDWLLNSIQNLPKSITFSREDFTKLFLLKRLSQKWPNIVGDVLADFTHPYDFTEDTLIVLSQHSAYSQEILFHSRAILEAFSSMSGNQKVKKIFCKIGKIHKPRMKFIQKKKKTLEGKEQLIESIQSIQDPELVKKLIELIQVLD